MKIYSTALPGTGSRRVLEPNERIAEVLFGLIMVLTFTGSLSVADAGRDDVRAMLIGAIGCNIAWGVIDGILYLMGCLSEKGQGIRTLRVLRKAASPEEAHRIITSALPTLVADTLGPVELESIRLRWIQLPEPPSRPRLSKDEWLGALWIFVLVFVITFPVAIPFVLMESIGPAMRVSNAIAVVLMFLTGYAFGRVAGYSPLPTGLFMVVLGSVLVAFTMALGG